MTLFSATKVHIGSICHRSIFYQCELFLFLPCFTAILKSTLLYWKVISVSLSNSLVLFLPQLILPQALSPIQFFQCMSSQN